MSAYPEPNYTQAPNAFFDEVLPQIETVAELKVTLAIMRQTFGWQRDEKELSLTRLEQLTGLRREGVSDGVKRGLERGHVTRRKKGNSYLYRLKVVGKPDQPADAGSRQTGPEMVGKPDQQVVGKPDPEKERGKEKERNSPNGATADAEHNKKNSPKDFQSRYIATLHERLRDRDLLEKRKLTKSYKDQLGGELREHLKTHDEATLWEAQDHIVNRWKDTRLELWRAVDDVTKPRSNGHKLPPPSGYERKPSKPLRRVTDEEAGYV